MYYLNKVYLFLTTEIYLNAGRRHLNLDGLSSYRYFLIGIVINSLQIIILSTDDYSE